MPEEDDGMPMWGVAPSKKVVGVIADLDSLARDFKFVVDVCNELLAREGDGTDGDGTIARALWEAAVISYGRAFASGVSFGSEARGSRLRVPEEVIDNLPSEMKELHDDLRDERNRHIAHRDDAREQVIVQVLLSNPAIRRRVEGVMIAPIRLIGPLTERLAKTRDLAHKLHSLAVEQLEVQTERLLQTAKDDLDGAYAHARPTGSGGGEHESGPQ